MGVVFDWHRFTNTKKLSRGANCKEVHFRLTIRLSKPMVVEQGQRFTIRNGKQTIVTGVVADLKPNLTEAEVDEFTMSKKKREKKLAERSEQQE